MKIKTFPVILSPFSSEFNWSLISGVVDFISSSKFSSKSLTSLFNFSISAQIRALNYLYKNFLMFFCSTVLNWVQISVWYLGSWVTFSCREIDDRFAATGTLFSMISTDFSTKFSMGFSSIDFDKISDGTVISGISGVLTISSISFLSSSHFFLATRKCAYSLSRLDKYGKKNNHKNIKIL